MAMRHAATRPAPESFSSLVSKYVTMVVSDENRGAKKTHMLRMSMVMLSQLSTW